MPCKSNIRFSHMKPSETLEENAGKEILRLEQHYPYVQECDVTIDLPNKHPAEGMQYEVSLRVVMHGMILPIDKHRNSDAYIALHDAFLAARRYLEHFKETQ